MAIHVTLSTRDDQTPKTMCLRCVRRCGNKVQRRTPLAQPNPTQTFRQSDNVSTIRQRFRHSDNGSDIPTFRQVDERSTTDKVCPSKQRARQTPDKRPTTPDIRCSDNARHVPTMPDKCPTIRQSVRHSDNSDKQGSASGAIPGCMYVFMCIGIAK